MNISKPEQMRSEEIRWEHAARSFMDVGGNYYADGRWIRQDSHVGHQNILYYSFFQKHKNSIRDASTPQSGEIVFNTMRYRSSEKVHRLGYFQGSVSVQIMFK